VAWLKRRTEFFFFLCDSFSQKAHAIHFLSNCKFVLELLG
jgi:hypothetical protein